MSVTDGGTPPSNIRAIKERQAFELTWPNSAAVSVPFKELRAQCPCASCVDEFTGKRILNPETIPADIRPEKMGFVGNYSLKIHWSDGHSTGLYTWGHLQRIAGLMGAQPPQ